MKKGMTHLKMRVLPPSIYSRWVNILGNIDLGENSYYGLYLASLAIGVMCAENTRDSNLGDSMPLTDQSQLPFDSVF